MAGGYGTGEPGWDGDGTADRPGPLPPRMAPPGAAAPFPGPPAPHPAPAGPDPARDAAAGYRPASGATYPDPAGQPGHDAGHRPAGGTYPGRPDLMGPAHPSARAAASVVPVQPTPASPHPTAGASYPGQPTSGPVYPGQSGSGSAYPAQPTSGPAYPGQPASGPAYPGQPASGPGYAAYPGQAPGGFGVPPVAHPDRSGRRGRLPVVALVLAGVLAVVTGVQAYQIHRLDDRLAAADRRTAEAQGADARRLDGLEQRAGSLEKQAGAAFNPEAVASAVLPSVFRVRAGQFTGTAFAVGKAPAGGGTTLLTNFHVVEAVFTAGERKVFLERTDQRFEATIVATDKEKDLAQLRTTAKFSGLVAARTPVKSGQQIVVVGAPLGLQDSVTTGVVSAFRKDEGGSGPVIQFDAPINPGNSGGPVINGSKEVVGIATAKARDAEGIGLAVPIKTACDRFKLC
ncbi:Trypsin-like peptidase domain-containing protein [Micromonospora sediminicola]|uniref:Trypsin-like peptidase domain-containing protein n=1 Tax=Micromonospora sediminicola TaxID=946078 RepID=A0A1A9BEP3_9ACTN|nr:Trypsin-like peptidase domain-containing protein [Micromonospora sediminicola]